MASGKIKGITIEIGGDTTKLGKAIENSEKQSRSLQGELKQIDKLLKFDPGNTELLAQKQEVLGKVIGETSDKLDTLRKAQSQVEKQFADGDIGEDQYRAFQREIVATEKKLNDYQKELEQSEKGLEEMDEATEKVEKSSGSLGSTLANVAIGGVKALATAVTAIGGALVGSAESTREYRADMGKLSTAFDTAGHSAESATSTYQTLQGVLGESDQAVEASNHLAKLAKNEEDLATWTTIATGVYAEFGASLPIENLTEASNETAKTGQLTGGLADALNWAGESEDAFQAKLDACTTEQERQALITETLNGLYSESAEKYRETNAEVIRANEANEALTSSIASVGSSVEPLITDVKLMGASLLSDLLPGISSVTEAFRGMLNGDEGASENLGSALSGLISGLLDKIVELLPTVATVAISLITTLTTTLISSLPQIIATGIEVTMAVITGITTAIPQITSAIVGMIPQLVSALVSGIPLMIQGAVNLLLAIVDAIPQILPPLISALPSIIMAIITGLLSAIPQLIQGALQLLLAIVQAIPLLVQELVPLVPTIVTQIVDTLIECLPLLLNGAITLFYSIIEALMDVYDEVIKVVPELITAVINLLKKLPGKLYDAIVGAVDLIGKWGERLDKKAKEKIQSMTSGIVTLAKSIPGKISSAISGAISAIGTWGKNMTTKAKDAISNVADKIKNGLKNVPESIKTIGKNIIEGLWNGINDKVTWLTNKIKSFASNVTDKLKSFFGIHSPSRVMRDQVGKYLAEGIGVGIDENADKPINSLNKLSKDMINGVQDINGATINKQIDSTFKSAPTGGSMSELINLMSNYMPQILEASKKAIVLDTGTLVGETINQIDRGLANNYALKARGI